MNGRNNQIVSRPAEGDDQRSWVVPGSRPQNCQPTDNDHVRCVSVFEKPLLGKCSHKCGQFSHTNTKVKVLSGSYTCKSR